ncbi:MAG TPA: DUF937 domain-containing protein [Saprospiraceae bacterium]|nr:DUF937 domain-containing protein [Saprospiraceae bacterium]
MSLMETLKSLLNSHNIQQTAAYLGESEQSTTKAMEAALATLVAATGEAGRSGKGIQGIWSLIRDEKNNPALGDNPGTLFAGTDAASSNTSLGAGLLAHLFGGKSTVLNLLSNYAGFNRSSSSVKILSIAAPLVLSFLKKQVDANGYDQEGMVQWLTNENQHLQSALPSGWMQMMGMEGGNVAPVHLGDPVHDKLEKPAFWWVWLVVLIAGIGGLWFCMKGCNQSEISDRANNMIQGAAAAVDSAKIRAELATKSAIAMMDSSAMAFRDRWQKLGNMINVKLGETNLNLPEKGVEISLLEWLQNKTTQVDKNTWFNFDRILFETGSSKLNSISFEQIDNIAAIMKAMPAVEFKIGGYTDNAGDRNANIQLSRERADAVMNALIERGIEAKRLSAEGYGPEHPVADNGTAEGREQNRRVAIRVTKK